jgi:hypothetical protein
LVGVLGGSQSFLPGYGDESVEPRLEGLESPELRFHKLS